MNLDPLPAGGRSFREVAVAAPRLVQRALRILEIPDRDREDVMQKVLLVVSQRLHTCDPSRPLRPWLWRVTFRTARDHRVLAHGRHETLTGSGDDLADAAPDSEQALLAGETRRRIEEHLGLLAPRYRAVLVLHYVDDLPMSEIASRLGIPVNTARTRLRLARASFKARWERAPEGRRALS